MQADSDPAPEPTTSVTLLRISQWTRRCLLLPQAEGFSRRGEALVRFHRAKRAGVWLGKRRTWVVTRGARAWILCHSVSLIRRLIPSQT